MFYTQSIFSSPHFIPSPYFIPSLQSVVHSPSFILIACTTWKTNCHQFNICWCKLLNCTNLMLENTLQLSLWRYVLNFIIVPKTLSTLFISTTIIVIIIIIVQHRSISTTLGFPKLWTAQPTCSRASPLMIVSSLSYWSALSACTFISSSLHIFISQKSVNVKLPFVFSFVFKPCPPDLNTDLSTISSYCLYFTFLVKTGWGGGVAFFSFGQEGGLSKNSVWCGGADLKIFYPFKKYPSPPPSIYITNAALCDVLYK